MAGFSMTTIDAAHDPTPHRQAPATRPPATRDSLLAQSGPGPTAIYGTVRRVLAEMEAAAPWDLLYRARGEAQAFLAGGTAMVEVVHSLPRLVNALDRELREAGMDEPAREDVAFYFGSVHAVLTHDVARLSHALGRLAAADGNLPGEEIENAAGLAADVLGKCSSSLFGVATNLVAEGRWSTEAVEAVLFPERGQDRRRSQQLVGDLKELVAVVDDFGRDTPLDRMVATWSAGRRVDPYALSGLSHVRGRIGRMLDERHRRALYTSDFHQLQRRERRLAQRVLELERLHMASWESRVSDAPEDLMGIGTRMAELAREIAAVLDIDLFTRLVGDTAVKSLRAAVEKAAERSGDDTGTGQPPVPRTSWGWVGVPEELRPLVSLVADEDLKTLLNLLLGTVQKRAALASGGGPGEVAAEVFRATALRPHVDASPPAASEASRLRTSREERALAIRALHVWLEAHLGKNNPQWNGFRMIRRLLSHRGNVPPGMFAAAQGFVADLRRELVPMLAGFTALGPLASDLSRSFDTDGEILSRDSLGPAEMRHQVPQAMQRIQDQLEALKSAATSLLAGTERRAGD
jgi:hypothetical protein